MVGKTQEIRELNLRLGTFVMCRMKEVAAAVTSLVKVKWYQANALYEVDKICTAGTCLMLKKCVVLGTLIRLLHFERLSRLSLMENYGIYHI